MKTPQNFVLLETVNENVEKET